jgi:hypothetical protein
MWDISSVPGLGDRAQRYSMIVKKSDRKKTTISIVNYSAYQDIETTEEPKKNHKKTTGRPLKDSNNNENNDNNILSKDNRRYVENELLNQAILDFIEYRKKKAPMTDKAIQLMIKELNKLSSNTTVQKAIINQSIMNGWRGIFPLKDEKPQKPTNKFNDFPQRTYTDYQKQNIERALLTKGYENNYED